MLQHDDENASSPSTTWGWRKVKITRPPKATGNSAARRASSPPLARSNPREPLTITVSYRGGAEAWWEIKARGRIWRRPGHTAIHDLLSDINDGLYHSGPIPSRPKSPSK